MTTTSLEPPECACSWGRIVTGHGQVLRRFCENAGCECVHHALTFETFAVADLRDDGSSVTVLTCRLCFALVTAARFDDHVAYHGLEPE